jgi:hypothetical protein
MELKSGMRAGVDGVSFEVGDHDRGAVTLTVAVPEGSEKSVAGGGFAATALLDPAEARTLAAMLTAAADAADEIGPPLYGD